jgi:hypothetical protein
MATRRVFGFVAIAALVTACASGGKKAHDSKSAASSSSEDSEVQIEYVPIAIAWVKRHAKGTSPDAAAHKLADSMLSRMQGSSESLDSIAEAEIRAALGAGAIADAKRRKAVTLPAARAGDADLPPDAKEALAAFARKAHPGDVVDSPLGSGPVLVVARAVR